MSQLELSPNNEYTSNGQGNVRKKPAVFVHSVKYAPYRQAREAVSNRQLGSFDVIERDSMMLFLYKTTEKL